MKHTQNGAQLGAQLAVQLAVQLGIRLALIVLIQRYAPVVFYGDTLHFREIARAIDWHHLPYRDVVWEFPPITLLTLLIGPCSFGSQTAFTILHGAAMAIVEYSTCLTLQRAFPNLAKRIGRCWTASVPALALFGWFRNDFIVVMFAAWALIAIERGRTATTPIVLGYATKLWPIVSLAVLAVQRRWKDFWRAAGSAAIVTAAWFAWSPGGFRTFFRYRQATGLEIESVPASLLLPFKHYTIEATSGAWVIGKHHFQTWSSILTVMLLGFVAFCVARAWSAETNSIALSGALVLGSMLMSRILSPQYLLWCAPAVVVLWAQGHRMIGWLYTSAAWLTTPILWNWAALRQHQQGWVELELLARNLILVTLLMAFTSAIRQPTVRRRTDAVS